MAKTPWGEIAIGDAHVHFFSHPFYAALAHQKKLETAESLQPLLNWEIPGSDPVALADRWVRELDRNEVKNACLMASIPGDEDSVAAAVAAHPSRFYGYFMLNPLQEEARAHVRGGGWNRHLHCICLFPAMHGYSINDERVQRVLDFAGGGGFTIFVHCGALSVGVRRKLGLESAFDMRYSNPLDLHPVAMRNPKTTFVVPHFGAGMFREALMLADLCPNVFLDTSSSNRWMAYEGLGLADVFRRALAVVGPERLLFGTDSSFFPRGWNAAAFQRQVAAMAEAGVNEAQARQILGGNLETLLSKRESYFSPGTKA
jgi:uncharacterized protein